MNTQVLIDSIVRQITVLIAQLATSGGIRAPVAHIANQVFLDLTNELEAQGVSRKVSADMFGMALRAYVRKIRRIEESDSDQGRTLWQAVLDFIRQEELVGRERILERFRVDGELEVCSTLRDLTETGQVFTSGAGRSLVYRVTTDDELGQLSAISERRGLDEFIWALVYRDGPITPGRVNSLLRRSEGEVDDTVTRLVEAGRIERHDDGRLTAKSFRVPLGASVGWEAAVFDHFQAVVQTICQRVRALSSGTEPSNTCGGSTYTFDVWPGHGLEAEVKGLLDDMRQRCSDLQRRVEAHNLEHGAVPAYQQVTTYLGQCMMEREGEPRNGET